MSRAPAARRVAASVVALVCLLASPALAPGSAAAAGEHHAAVIVETGDEVHRVVVTFSEDSISGIEALQRAGANPIAAGFSGLGAGVCELYGVGHPATVNECLGVPGDPRFWAYWHVPAGQSGFDDSTWSRAGAGSVRVHDGDTEGWRFGTGEPPTFATLAVPEPEPPAATSPPPPPVSASDGPAVDSSGGGGGPAGPAAGAVPGTTSTTLAPGAGGPAGRDATRRASTTTTRSRAEVEASRASATSRSDGDEDSGGTILSFVGFAAVLAVLATGIYLARRARVGRTPSGP